MKVIIYGDFNCLYCYLASQRADRLVRAGITAEVITYPGGGGHQRHLLGRPSRPAGWERSSASSAATCPAESAGP